MAKVRNISGEARYVPELRTTADVDDVVDVPDDRLWGGYVQPSWQESPDPVWELVSGPDEPPAPAVQHADEPPTPEDVAPAQPKGNASREEWALWVLDQQLATGEQIEQATRDDLRDSYGQED